MVRSRGNRGRGRAGQGRGRGGVGRGRGSRRGRVVTNRQPTFRENSREDDTFVWNGENDLYFFNCTNEHFYQYSKNILKVFNNNLF